MKFTAEKDKLLDALQKVQSIVPQRPALPILGNVLLEVDEKGISTFTTTDQEVTVRARAETEDAQPGAVTLPARRFFSILRELPSPRVEIVLNEEANVVEISSGASFFKLEGISAEEFPEIPSFSESFSYLLEQPVLKSLLLRTSYAASTDETRAILNGALFSFRDGKLSVVCTDGRRLALAEHEMEIPPENETDIVVPAKTIGELVKTLGDEGEVSIRSSATQAAFEFDDILVITKLIEGTFPNYRQVIPTQCEERIAVEREAFQDAIRRVSVMLDDQTASVRLHIQENRIELSTFSPEVGEARDVLPVKYSGKELTIAFNPTFLAAPLKHLDSDEVYLELSDELSPGVIKSNIPFLYVIMPIRLK